MQHKLDFTEVWNDALVLLRTHKEAVLAIAGLFLFIPTWVDAYLVGVFDISGVKTIPAIIAALNAYWVENGAIILPTTLISMVGGFALYVLMICQDLPRVGDALVIAFKRFPLYFLVSLCAGIFIIIGFVGLILPGFYLSARFAPLPSIMAAGQSNGVFDSLRRSWHLTQDVGWAIFLLTFIVTVVGLISIIVAELLVGLPLKLLGEGDAAQFIEAGFSSLFDASLDTLMIALGVAIYRHLKSQDVAQI